MSDLEVEKKLMLESHLRRRDITDALVLEAFRTVPREDFLPPDMADDPPDHIIGHPKLL